MIDKLKKFFKTPYDKIGFAIVIFGLLAMIISQTSKSEITIGQSILVGSIFVVIGLIVRKVGNKKKTEPLIKGSVEMSVSEFEYEEPDLTPLPIAVSYPNTEKPSERQISYATERFGIKVLDTHYFADVSQMISRYEDMDYNRPPLALAQYALDIGAEITPYIGANALIGRILHILPKHEQIGFYAYSVYCSALGKELGDFRKSPYYDKFIEFGKSKVDDVKFIKSIENRPNSDYYKPNHSTIAYAAVLDLMKTF